MGPLLPIIDLVITVIITVIMLRYYSDNMQ